MEMPKMKKLHSPHFVSAKLLKDGTVELIDDDGENYHVMMRRDQEWPEMSRAVRKAEMRAAGEKFAKELRILNEPPKPPHPFFPRLVS